MRNKIKLNYLLLMLLMQSVCVGNSSATVYVYVLPDGSSLITDRKQLNKDYRLKKSYPTPSKEEYRYSNSKPVISVYDGLIGDIASKHQLEPSFVKAIIHVESAFNPNAISNAGAMGLMQLMPDTASLYSLNRDHFDPTKNLEAGMRHLKDLLTQYDQDKTLSLAAYNAGEGAVNKYKGVPPYNETMLYVEKVMKLYRLYKINS